MGNKTVVEVVGPGLLRDTISGVGGQIRGQEWGRG